jgi:hypothetical protein
LRVRPAWAVACRWKSCVGEVMPTLAKGNCVAVRRGGKEAWRRNPDLRDTNHI